MEKIDREKIISVFQKKGYSVEDSGGRIIGEKDGMRLSVLFATDGSIAAILEEMDGTGTFLRLEAARERGVSLSMEEKDGELFFIRLSKGSRTELQVI